MKELYYILLGLIVLFSCQDDTEDEVLQEEAEVQLPEEYDLGISDRSLARNAIRNHLANNSVFSLMNSEETEDVSQAYEDRLDFDYGLEIDDSTGFQQFIPIKTHSQELRNLVIVEIDDETYSFIYNKYGSGHDWTIRITDLAGNEVSVVEHSHSMQTNNDDGGLWDDCIMGEISFNCTGGGNHAPGDPDCGCTDPQNECTPGWISTFPVYCFPDGGASGGGGTGGGGSGPGGVPEDPIPPVYIIPDPPVTPNPPPSDDPADCITGWDCDDDEIDCLNGDCNNDYESCINIHDEEFCDCFYNDPNCEYEDSADYYSHKSECGKMDSIATNQPVYLGYVRDLNARNNDNFETMIAVNTGNQYPNAVGTPEQPYIEINWNISPFSIISFAHNHPNGGSLNTSSIFSAGDLNAIYKGFQDNKLVGNEFVAYLTTAKGTYYALTIEDASKFKAFFEYKNYDVIPNIGIDPDWKEKGQARDNYLATMKKYFGLTDEENDIVIPGIIDDKASSNKNIANRNAFARFLYEADLGMTLFETDENFQDFTRVKYNGSNIKLKPC